MSSQTSKLGFSLIEAAIVLGVVGLVIGGIWVAAATVSENQKINRTTSAVLQIVTGLQEKMPRSAYGGAGADLYDVTYDLGIWPADFPDHNDLWGNYLGLYWNSGGPGIGIGFSDLTKSRCIKLITSITSHFKDNTNLLGVWTEPASWIDTYPVLPDSTPCQDPTTYMEFQFSLNRNN